MIDAWQSVVIGLYSVVMVGNLIYGVILGCQLRDLQNEIDGLWKAVSHRQLIEDKEEKVDQWL